MQYSKWMAGAVLTSAAALITSGVGLAEARPAALPNGDTVVMALPSQVNLNWFNPIVDIPDNSLYNAWVWNQLYHPLIQLKNNGAFNWQHSIASHVQYNSKGTVYTVTMNRKWHWSNGTPVTTKDVLFTWHLIQDTSSPKAPKPWPYTGAGTGDIPTGVQSVTAQGPYKFTVTLKAPANQDWFIYSGLNQLTPLPASVWNRYPKNLVREDNFIASLADKPMAPEYQVVDGPYEFSQAVTNQKWVLVANPHYDGHKPAVKRIIFQYFSSDTAEFAALRTGQVQFGYLPFAQWGARSQLTGHYRLWFFYPLQYNDVLLNMNEGKTAAKTAPNGVAKLFNQLYIRQAFQLGINQNAINKATLNGNGIDEYTAMAAKPKSVFFPPNLKAAYPFNPKRGMRILEAHGWRMKNGVMTRGKTKLQFTLQYTSGNQQFTEQATLLKQGWGEEGIQVSLVPRTFNTLIAETPNQWEIIDYGGITYGGSYPSGDGLFETPGVGLNQQGYYNPTMVKLIKASLKPYPTIKMDHEALWRYLAFVGRDLPILFVPDAPTYEEVAKNLHGTHASMNNFTEEVEPQYWYYTK